MELLEQQLPAPPKQEQVAAGLNMSVRNLQRKLEAEGTGFQQLLDHTRRTLAQRWLDQPGCNVQQVADGLGFANPSAFTRAFKRWTGVTPEAYRAGNAGR